MAKRQVGTTFEGSKACWTLASSLLRRLPRGFQAAPGPHLMMREQQAHRPDDVPVDEVRWLDGAVPQEA